VLRREASQTAAAKKVNASAVVRMKLVGGNRRPQVEGLRELPGKLNYLLGNDPQNWRTAISTYEEVRCRNAYPGIDLVYHGNQQQLEYDFIVAPGRNPERIRLAFTGVQETKLQADGSLLLST